MNTQAKIIIGVLIAAVAALGIAFGVMAADDGDDSNGMGHMDADDAYMGMMGAMGSMDSDDMLEHMRDVLGDEGYARMMQHFQDHQNGMMTGDGEVDGMMHQMMDGMMQHMPQDSGGMLPSDIDQHHEPPVAGTPTN